MVRNFSGSGQESHPLDRMPVSQPPPSSRTADGNPNVKTGNPDVVPPRPAAPPRPAPPPPTEPVDIRRVPSSVCILQHLAVT